MNIYRKQCFAQSMKFFPFDIIFYPLYLFKGKGRIRHLQTPYTACRGALAELLMDVPRAAQVGCAEGGCGACAVLVARPGGGRPASLNACLTPLASLHGCAVTTAAGIGNHQGGYSAVQGGQLPPPLPSNHPPPPSPSLSIPTPFTFPTLAAALLLHLHATGCTHT